MSERTHDEAGLKEFLQYVGKQYADDAVEMKRLSGNYWQALVTQDGYFHTDRFYRTIPSDTSVEDITQGQAVVSTEGQPIWAQGYRAAYRINHFLEANAFYLKEVLGSLDPNIPVVGEN